MKEIIFPLLAVLLLSGCAQDTTPADSTAVVTLADVQELENLESEINADLREIDSLLEEFDATNFEDIELGLEEVQ